MKGSPSSHPRSSETDPIQLLNHGPFKESRVPASVEKRNACIMPVYSHACCAALRQANPSFFWSEAFMGGWSGVRSWSGEEDVATLAASLSASVSLLCPVAQGARESVVRIIIRDTFDCFLQHAYPIPLRIRPARIISLVRRPMNGLNGSGRSLLTSTSERDGGF